MTASRRIVRGTGCLSCFSSAGWSPLWSNPPVPNTHGNTTHTHPAHHSAEVLMTISPVVYDIWNETETATDAADASAATAASAARCSSRCYPPHRLVRLCGTHAGLGYRALLAGSSLLVEKHINCFGLDCNPQSDAMGWISDTQRKKEQEPKNRIYQGSLIRHILGLRRCILRILRGLKAGAVT